MAVSGFQVKVVGVAEGLKYLRGYDKELYNIITKKMRTSATGLASAVGGDFPSKTLTYWNGKPPKKRLKQTRPFPLYDATAARGGVRPKVGVGRLVNGERNILRIQQMTAGGAVFDSAGSQTTNIFTKNLDIYAPTKGTTRRGVSRSRVLYKAVDKRMDTVDGIVQNAIHLTDRIVQQAIKARGR